MERICNFLKEAGELVNDDHIEAKKSVRQS